MKGSSRALAHQLALLAFRQAEVEGDVEATGTTLARAGGIVSRHFELRQVLLHPSVGAERKLELLGRLLPLAGTGASVLRAVLERRLAGMLSGISRAYGGIAAAQSATATVLVEAAAPLTRRDVARIRETLERSMHRPVALKVVTRRELIGGLRVVAGELVIDGTVKGALDRLERELVTDDSRRG
ncbi:MAG: ATP synthase F1 subunit delta [Candidatus Coatesbacteria bacterium]